MELNYSFIIPHHNTPDLLQRLIDTIPQRDDIEIIVVDDNSDEGRKANITRSDVRTICIDKVHTKGAGHARNVGMEVATGKWLLFADADDLYKPGFIDVLDEHKDDDIEILFFNVDSVDSDTLIPNNRAKIPSSIIANYDGSEKTTFELLYLNYSPWNKMISSQFIKNKKLSYEEILKGNDVLFALELASFVKTFKVENRILYTLTYYKESLTYGKKTINKYMCTLNNMIHRRTFFKEMGFEKWYRTSIRGTQNNSPLRFIFGLIRKSPKTGLIVLSNYIFNYYSIWNNSDYYLKQIKLLEENGQ